MKKTLLLILIGLMGISPVFAGGLLTNSNQSTQYIRMLSRNASTDIDAVYYNPAGLTQLQNGWHLGVYSQTIFQNKIVDSEFPLLNNGHYEGDVTIPVFPDIYGVYKKDKWALSFGLGPNSGGGLAKFDRGLASFEIPITKVVPGLAGLTQIDPSLSVTGYDANLTFEGTSIFWGLQFGATYKFNDVVSLFGGARLLPAKNKYEGSIRDVQLVVGGAATPAAAFMNQTSTMLGGLSSQASAAATTLGGTAQSMQGLIDNGVGGLTFAQLEGAGAIDAGTRAQLEGGLLSLGLTQAQVDALPATQAQSTFSTAAATYSGQSTALAAQSAGLAAKAPELEDREVETKQTGLGITPMLGLSITPNEKWHIGLKYEMKTTLTLTNDTKADDLDLYPDGGKVANDLPAILAIGVAYKASDLLELQLSLTNYFDKGVNWARNVRDVAIWKNVDQSKIRDRDIDENSFELALGAQFNLSEKFALSLGGMRSRMAMAENFQSDFSYGNPSYTAGMGAMWKLSDKTTFDFGISNTFYEDQTVSFDDPDLGVYDETYGKKTFTVSFGISHHLF